MACHVCLPFSKPIGTNNATYICALDQVRETVTLLLLFLLLSEAVLYNQLSFLYCTLVPPMTCAHLCNIMSTPKPLKLITGQLQEGKIRLNPKHGAKLEQALATPERIKVLQDRAKTKSRATDLKLKEAKADADNMERQRESNGRDNNRKAGKLTADNADLEPEDTADTTAAPVALQPERRPKRPRAQSRWRGKRSTPKRLPRPNQALRVE
jgi:hypothetical protein